MPSVPQQQFSRFPADKLTTAQKQAVHVRKNRQPPYRLWISRLALGTRPAVRTSHDTRLRCGRRLCTSLKVLC